MSGSGSTSQTWRRGDELTATELYALLQLRVEVFVVEQECAYDETDGADLWASTEHGWIERNGLIASSVRLLSHEDPPRIGRVVTAEQHRGAAMAAPLVLAAHERAIDAGANATQLDAQTYLVGWYDRLGWVVNGVEFVEDGIAHVPMVRTNDSRLG